MWEQLNVDILWVIYFFTGIFKNMPDIRTFTIEEIENRVITAIEESPISEQDPMWDLIYEVLTKMRKEVYPDEDTNK